MFSFIGQHFVALVIVVTAIFAITLMAVTIADHFARWRSATKSGAIGEKSHSQAAGSRR